MGSRSEILSRLTREQYTIYAGLEFLLENVESEICQKHNISDLEDLSKIDSDLNQKYLALKHRIGTWLSDTLGGSASEVSAGDIQHRAQMIIDGLDK